jgi:hypothetical protein
VKTTRTPGDPCSVSIYICISQPCCAYVPFLLFLILFAYSCAVQPDRSLSLPLFVKSLEDI